MRELRMLAAHAPPYNRRSKFPHRWWWVVLTDEAFPRFSVVRAPRARPRRRPVPVPRRRRRDRRAAGPVHRRADLHHAAGPLGAARAGLPEREVSPCPAARDVTAGAVRRRGRAGRGADRRRWTTRALAAAARADRRRSPSGSRYETRRAAARPHRHRHRGAVARPAAARAGRGRRAGGRRARTARAAGTSRSIRHGQLAAAGNARRGVPPMPVVDAIGAGAQAILPQPAPLGGALVEETALIARWLAAAGRAHRAGRDGDGLVPHRLRSAGRLGGVGGGGALGAAGRRAGRHDRDSELLGEPHPTREQLFGRPGVDRLGGAGQPGLPRRHPFGVAG